MKPTTNAPPAQLYLFGDFRLDAAKRLLSRGGSPVPLTPRVFETLLFLVEHRDTVLEKERLMEAVWPDCIVEENNLTQNISTLRRAFGEKPGSHRFIVTVPGRGYRFVAGVKTRPANSGSGLPGASQSLIAPVEMELSQVSSVFPAASASAGRDLRPIVLPIIGVLVLVVGALLLWRGRTPPSPNAPAKSATAQIAIPEKSIAVLPFANLSTDQENAFFTEGMQDDILTAVSRIADLKVISRTSVATYLAGQPRNLREIGQDLGVSQVLEGSVRRAGDRVRVTVQLIDTLTNAHVWAETYDRSLADVFAIQTEIAQQISTQLQAKLSPVEKSAIEERPTEDLAAYDLYLRAKALWGGWSSRTPVAETLLEIASVLDQAIARDGQFFLAYCHLARTHDALYFNGGDHSLARLALADAAISNALRLRPNSGEAHLVRAEHLYRGYLDYDQARSELALAQRLLPNDAEIFRLMAHIDRRQGRWSESTRNYEKALVLNPRDVSLLGNAAVNYEYHRRFAEAAALRDRVIRLYPASAGARRMRANIDFAWRADPRPLHEAIDAMVAENPLSAQNEPDEWLDLALCEHDPAMVERALAAMKTKAFEPLWGFPHGWYEGLAARARGDAEAARAAFTSAHGQSETMVREQPDSAPRLCALGMIDAALGRKDEAIREAQRALELLPVSKNAMEGPIIMEYLAVIYAWSEEKDLAIEQVAATLKIPSHLSYGYLRLHPFWDPLRGDPRFEKIVADLAPPPSSGR